jgi:hypothetical protein
VKNFLNWFSAGFAAFFFIPTLLIMVSWNAVPGDSLYGLKTALEDVALALTIRTPLASTLSVGYTERRFSEANVLLSKNGSTVGYKLLVSEAGDSKDIIVDKKDTKKAAQLITQIEGYQKDIEQKQQLIRQGQLAIPTKQATFPTAGTPAPTSQATPVPAAAPPITVTATPKPTAPSVITADESDDEVLQNLEDTNIELEKIIDEIKKKLPEQASPQAQEAIENANEKKEENENRGKND